MSQNMLKYVQLDSSNLEAGEQESFEPADGNGSFQQIRPEAEKSRYCKNWPDGAFCGEISS